LKLLEKTCLLSLIALGMSAGCFGYGTEDTSPSRDFHRYDEAHELNITWSGSLQNPAWSPDGRSILFTRFIEGYNKGPADLLILRLGSNSNGTNSSGTGPGGAASTRVLVSDGSGNVNLPGSAWNPNTHEIVFSSSRGPHDEIYIIAENGAPGDERKTTERDDRVAYEPSLSPDGQWVVFESHRPYVEGNGVITRYRIDGTGPYEALTGIDEDCRQPNWSPAGDLILYQRFAGGRWDIWTMDPDGSNHTKLTGGNGDKTDASFSPDGQWIVFSSDAGTQFADLFVISISGGDTLGVTRSDWYDGAPSWSPDGKRIVFESCPGDPDDSAGTALWIIDVPADREEVLKGTTITLV